MQHSVLLLPFAVLDGTFESLPCELHWYFLQYITEKKDILLLSTTSKKNRWILSRPTLVTLAIASSIYEGCKIKPINVLRAHPRMCSKTWLALVPPEAMTLEIVKDVRLAQRIYGVETIRECCKPELITIALKRDDLKLLSVISSNNYSLRELGIMLRGLTNIGSRCRWFIALKMEETAKRHLRLIIRRANTVHTDRDICLWFFRMNEIHLTESEYICCCAVKCICGYAEALQMYKTTVQ